MHGREAVRQWIVPLMSTYPNTKMVKYTHDWVYFDASTAEMVFCARTHMADLGDGMDYTATNWTRVKYAGDGLFSLEEDIYNPANFVALIQRWEAAAQQAKPLSKYCTWTGTARGTAPDRCPHVRGASAPLLHPIH